MQSSRRRAVSRGVIAVILIIILIFAVGAAYLFGTREAPATTVTATVSTSTVSQTSTSSAPAAGNVVNVYIADGLGYPYSDYSPAVIRIVIGVNSTVVWTNQDEIVHDVRTTSAPLGSIASGPSSGDLTPFGGTYTFTFTLAGNYSYYCSYHPWMTGEIIVKNA